MKKKKKTFIYKGFGFPIKLINVPMIKVLGEWAMDVNFNKLQIAVLQHLIRKPMLLNGDEIKFVRKFLNMTTTEFGEIFNVSHVTVMNWEKGINKIAPTADIYLRLYLLHFQQAKGKDYNEMVSTINPQILAKSKGGKILHISINIDEDLAAG